MSEKPVKVLKSVVTDFKDIDFESKNPLAQQLNINFENMEALFIFQDEEFTIRLPDNRITDRYSKLVRKQNFRNQNNVREKLKDDPKLTEDIQNVQSEMIEDMIPGLVLSERRIDDFIYLQLTSLCWEFYHFLKPKLEERMRDYTSSIKSS